MTARIPLAALLILGGFAFGQAAQASSSDRGEALFETICSNCHSVASPPRNKMGPRLLGVVGRPIGAADGYRYSDGFAAIGAAWTPEFLDAYLVNPKLLAPNGRMNFKGLSDIADRAAIIAYLASQNHAPD